MVMEKEQIPINFELVTNFAKASKTTLYADETTKTKSIKLEKILSEITTCRNRL